MKKKLAVYLAGAIEKAADEGVGWRNEITPFLKELDLDVLDPCALEAEKLKNFQPNRLPEFIIHIRTKEKIPCIHWHQLKNADAEHLRKRFKKYMRRIIKYDIGVIRKSADYLIVYWDKNTGKGAGTHGEVTDSFLRGIPVYCVAEVDPPAWIVGCCEEIFFTFDDLKKFLQEEFGDE